MLGSLCRCGRRRGRCFRFRRIGFGGEVIEPAELTAPIIEDMPLQESATAIRLLESLTLKTPGLAGTVLRYGLLYGPGTGCDVPSGPITLHVDDAARAALLAATTTVTGIFNIVDDGGPVSNTKAKSVLGWLPATLE